MLKIYLQNRRLMAVLMLDQNNHSFLCYFQYESLYGTPLQWWAGFESFMWVLDI